MRTSNPLTTGFLLTCIWWFSTSVVAQKTDASALAEAAAGLELRRIGPAVMGGRIADIAVSPKDPSTWYVAVGSGGVWKTTNRGTTWEPVFEDQPSYSVRTVTLDPDNPEVVWVGTGENVSGRHVAELARLELSEEEVEATGPATAAAAARATAPAWPLALISRSPFEGGDFRAALGLIELADRRDREAERRALVMIRDEAVRQIQDFRNYILMGQHALSRVNAIL